MHQSTLAVSWQTREMRL